MSVRERFTALMAQDSEQIPVDEAALLVAAEEYPELDIAAYLRRLDAMAAALGPQIAHELEPAHLAQTLNAYLFDALGFRGNVTEYYDPRNSFLNEVIDRRLGIPITLAIVYVAVARRLGLPVTGVSFPGHFIVTYQASPTPLYLDPFNQGRLVQENDFRRFLLEQFGPRAELDPAILGPATAHETMARLLGNLKHIYLAQDDLPRAIACSERIVIATNVPRELRDLGILLVRAGRLRDAIPHLKHYLAGATGAPDWQNVEDLVGKLQRAIRRLN